MRPSSKNLSLLLLSSVALPLCAQTATHKTAARPTARPAEHRTAGAACMELPTISPSIPALPAGTACPKALYTITRRSDLTLDYQSPIITGDYLAKTFGTLPTTITLGYVDVRVGAGELAKPGMYLTVKYAGYLVNGTKFDSSDDHPGKEPITFPYGEHKVIAGWDTGFEGMRVGGKRRLFVPYQLAYGDAGKPPTIPAKSLLVFDMELVSESATPPAPPTPPTPPAGAKPAITPPATTPAKPTGKQ